LEGIRACQELLPGIPQVAVFDTAFHQTIPKHAFIYGLPYRYYEKYRIRRYGFHGTSHFYVSRRAAELAGIPFSKAKIITCHLGNGSSIAAIRNGKCIDTSMGFTPLEGLVMGSRSGDVDVSAILFLMQNENLSPQEADRLLNNESGLKGISEYSNNMRLLLQRADAGDEKSKLAIDVFCYRVKKYIGSYVAALNGLDLLVFTGGIGENSPSVRTKICDELDFLGIQLDHFTNRQVEHSEAKVSRDGSLVQVWVVPTNEELVIASQTLDLIYSK
jgi:acetate kinase